MPHSYHMTRRNWLRAASHSKRTMRILCPLCPKPDSWPISLYYRGDDSLWNHWYYSHDITKLEDLDGAFYDAQTCRYTFVCPVCQVDMRYEANEKVGFDKYVKIELGAKRPVYYMMLHFLCMHRDQQKEHIAIMLMSGIPLKGI